MFRAIKIINSRNKKNIRFVASGSYQIEFFENNRSQYFTIYRFNYGGEGASQYYLINLNNSEITQISKTEVQIVQGASIYKLHTRESDNKTSVYITRYLWGWLPLGRFGVKASQAGLSLLKSSIEQYLNDLEV
ncbi:hypothetical protein MAH1_31940 [Sessilibacter sp. MAH1]